MSDELIIENIPYAPQNHIAAGCVIGVDYAVWGEDTTTLHVQNSAKELVSVSSDGSVMIVPDITLEEALIALEYLAEYLWRIKS